MESSGANRPQTWAWRLGTVRPRRRGRAAARGGTTARSNRRNTNVIRGLGSVRLTGPAGPDKFRPVLSPQLARLGATRPEALA